MPDQIEKQEKEKRAAKAIEYCDKIRAKEIEKMIGKTEEILFETRTHDGFAEGYTENYTPVRVKGENLTGKIAKVKLLEYRDDFCYGEIV